MLLGLYEIFFSSAVERRDTFSEYGVAKGGSDIPSESFASGVYCCYSLDRKIQQVLRQTRDE